MNSRLDQVSQRSRELYWRQLIELKTASVYMRLYRDDRGRWVSGLAVLRAIASSGGIAAWAVWREYALVWAAIIAAAQVADAVKEVFPFSRQYRAASEHMLALDRLLIDSELEWVRVFSGDYPEDEILSRRYRLMLLRHEAERKNFPDGLPRRNDQLWTLAEQEAKAYISVTYDVETQS